MAEKHPPSSRLKTKVEIPIHSIKKYVPGSGPPPAQIFLAPPRDSTAYIIDQFVLPPLAETTETTRRLIHYHIGFTDNPALKVLIPCHKVLDYVSPRELEDWEFDNAERIAEEKAKELAKRKAAAAEASKKRGVGRPPKVRPEELEEGGNPPATDLPGPSLSTPLKKKTLDLLMDEPRSMDAASNVDSDDAAIQRQLQGELGDDDDDMGSETADELGLNPVPVTQLPPLRPNKPGFASFSRANSLVSSQQVSSSIPSSSQKEDLVKEPIPRKITPILPPVPPRREHVPPKVHKEPAVPKVTPILPPVPPPITSANTTPGRIHPAWAQAYGIHNHNTPLRQGKNGHVQKSGVVETITPRQPQSKARKVPYQPKVTPVPLPSTVAKVSSLPAPTSSWAPAAVAKPRFNSEPSTGKRKTPMSSRDSSKEPREKKPKKANPKKETKIEPPPIEQEWEVQELLSDRWSNKNGVKVHEYLVLWVGDWPEGQNPTWEPVENIQDHNLIHLYHQKKSAGVLKVPQRIQNTIHKYLATGSQYSNALEAFEGDLAEEDKVILIPEEVDDDWVENKHVGKNLDEDEDEEEEFIVTDDLSSVPFNGKKSSARKQASTPSTFRSFDSMLKTYNTDYRG